MLKKHAKGLNLALAIIIAISALTFFLFNGNASAEKKEETVAEKADTTKPVIIDVEAAMKDRTLGLDTAPVSVIEYASMTCGHCAHFEKDILPEFKKRFIDTGMVKFTFRDFPLDKYALKAAMMARCADPKKYFNLVDVIFNNQERWSTSKNPVAALAQLGALAGMNDETFKACTENTELEIALVDRLKDAQIKHKIQSTPTFIFNNGVEIIAGAKDIEKFAAIIEKLSK